MLSRRLAVTVALSAVAVLAAGCGVSADDWSGPHAKPVAIGSLGPGFTDPAAPPTPESTVTPAAGSWAGVHPPAGYRVVLISAGSDRATGVLADAVAAWAEQEGVSLKTLHADDSGRHVGVVVEAMALRPALIVSAGNDLVDALTVVTANHLDQQFLVLGAELAEPTVNVTAANWPGASFRGEGLTTSTGYDPASFTQARAAAAIRAGVASVLHDVTGIVLRLP